MIVSVCAVGGTVASQDAQAFAWKDTCEINVVNRAAQSQVRPIALVEVPPNPIAYAKYVALVATGFPSNTGISFANTGFPLTGGCSAALFLNNPGDNVKCSASAPTVGANNFSCVGNQTARVDKDNDDITGTVFVAPNSLGEGGEESTDPPALLNRQVDPFAGAKAKPKAPKVPAGVLSKGQLSGKGWQKTIKVSDLGQFGKALEASDPKGACNDSDEKGVPKALSGGASLFVRGAGGEAIGELDGRYKTAGQAEATMEIATSARSMRCLAASLTSSDYKAKVAADGPDFGQGGVVTNRVVLKHGGFTGYVDVVGLADGRSNTVLVFFNHGKPAEVSHEEDVLEAVADDLRP
jgi:hypothetical protein